MKMKTKTFATLLTLLFIITVYFHNANAEDYTQVGYQMEQKHDLEKGP